MKYFVTIAIMVGLITSCSKDFLDQTDPSNLNRQTYVTDLNSLQDFTNGIQALTDRFLLYNLGGAYGDVIADNVKPSTAFTPMFLGPHYRWSQVAEDGTEQVVSYLSLAMNGEWRSCYLIVRQCNFVIEEIGKYYSENPVVADKLKGQAMAIRAVIYHKLVNIFAQNYSFTPDGSHPGIPYIKTSDVSQSFHRNTVAEVYTFLISDLTEAIQLLPESFRDSRFMTKNAARAFLARVYLYKGDFPKAKETALEVASRVPILKISDGYPNAISKYIENPGNNETIYQLTPTYTEVEDLLFSTTFVSNSYRGNRLFATQDIVTVLQEIPDDIRNSWVTPSGAEWQIVKYPIGVANKHLIPRCDYYQPVIRSSEMFLTIAEAASKTGDENTAREYLNAVRQRAAPLLTPVIATGPALLDSIYKERRKEFAFEGTRMFDIQRWHQKVQRTDALFSDSKELPYPSNKAIAPIPMVDVKVSGLKQNPDY